MFSLSVVFLFSYHTITPRYRHHFVKKLVYFLGIFIPKMMYISFNLHVNDTNFTLVQIQSQSTFIFSQN